MDVLRGQPAPARAARVRLTRAFFARPARTLARDLLGRVLVRSADDGRRLAGIIVEVEAYLGVRDMASHAFAGRRSPRNESMYQPPGTAYVYFTYGMHHCLNVVAGRSGEPVAVLVRAIEPIEGIEAMRARRAGRRDRDLCRGPGRVCAALGIDRALDGLDLVRDARLWIEAGSGLPGRVARSPRIGIDPVGERAGGLEWRDALLRFFIEGNIFTSGT